MTPLRIEARALGELPLFKAENEPKAESNIVLLRGGE